MRSCTLALALLLPLAACDDDGGGTSTPATPFEASAPDEKGIGELSTDEQVAMCNELAAYFDAEVPPASQKKLACYFFALAFTGGDRQACEQAAQGCITDPEMDAGSDEVSCNTDRLSGCAATVAEIEACFSDMTSITKSLAGRVSCSTSASDLQALSDKPASCKTVETKCPNLFEDDADPTPE